ncbi:hypothetical protein N665_0368s0006, partial [Sinapis alba]
KTYVFLLLYLLLQNDKVSVLDLVRKRKKQQKQRFSRDGLKKITSKRANVIKGVLWHTGLRIRKDETVTFKKTSVVHSSYL